MVTTRRSSGRLKAVPKEKYIDEDSDMSDGAEYVEKKSEVLGDLEDSDASAAKPSPAKRPRTSKATSEKPVDTKSLKKKTASVVESTSTKDASKRKRRGNTGKLSLINSIPTDVFLEISSHLHPMDLLRMARTTHAWRDVLLSRSSKPIWRAARGTIDGLPDCPEDLSEAEYARLLFERDCYLCGTTNVPKAEFALRVRCCNTCARANIFSRRRFQHFFPDTDDVVLDLLPYTNTGAFSHGHSSKSQFYYMDSVVKAAAEMIQMEETCKEDEYEAWYSEKVALAARIIQNGKELEKWHRDQTVDKAKEKDALASKRRAAIKQKFIELGYDERDLRWSYTEQKLLDKPQALTDRIWMNIRRQLEKKVIEKREDRLQAERERQMTKRQVELHPLYESLYSAQARSAWTTNRNIFPTRADFFRLPSIAPFVDRVDPIPEDDWPERSVIMREAEEHISHIMQEIQVALSRAMKEGFPGAAEEVIQTRAGYGYSMGLVDAQPAAKEPETNLSQLPSLDHPMSVVLCSAHACEEPLHWPELLQHEHIRSAEGYYHYGVQAKETSKPWDIRLLRISRLTHCVMEGLLKGICLRDEIPTLGDLEGLKTIQCLRCTAQFPSWKKFFTHFITMYHREVRDIRGGHETVSKHDPTKLNGDIARHITTPLPKPSTAAAFGLPPNAAQASF